MQSEGRARYLVFVAALRGFFALLFCGVGMSRDGIVCGEGVRATSLCFLVMFLCVKYVIWCC
jgi:hypothetical protein